MEQFPFDGILSQDVTGSEAVIATTTHPTDLGAPISALNIQYTNTVDAIRQVGLHRSKGRIVGLFTNPNTAFVWRPVRSTCSHVVTPVLVGSQPSCEYAWTSPTSAGVSPWPTICVQ